MSEPDYIVAWIFVSIAFSVPAFFLLRQIIRKLRGDDGAFAMVYVFLFILVLSILLTIRKTPTNQLINAFE